MSGQARKQKSFAGAHSVGTLYLVATPIGNLEDMTFRAVHILKEVGCIAAEDTRQTRKLLTHFGISGTLLSYHEHNKQKSGPQLLERLEAGENVALVSDAGLPAISDPGAELVAEAAERGIPVVPIPGANAALSALIASGLPTDTFTFLGFLPREKKKAAAVLAQWKTHQATLILYEAPHRITATLKLMLTHWGNRRITLARELTKRYEEFMRGTIEGCIEQLESEGPVGEYCIVVEGSPAHDQNEADDHQAWWRDLTPQEHVAHYERTEGMSSKDALKRAAADRGVPKRELYAEIHREK